MQGDTTERFEQGVLDTIRRRGLLAPGDRVVVAVSGGPDSLALLYALHALRDRLGVTLHVAHLNHRLRRAAPAEARFVAETAVALGLPCTVEAVDVRAAQRRTGASLEHAARRERYRFFARVAAETGASRIATAHTADDNAETVLIHLLRGAGTDGLAGIPPSRELQIADCRLQIGGARARPPHAPPTLGGYGGAEHAPVGGHGGAEHAPILVVRPLIDTWRADVEAYCRAKGLQPREDTSNRSRAFLRNRVRLDLLPYLGRHFGPEVKPNLRRLAEIARPEVELLERLAEEAAAQVAWETDAGIAISATGLMGLPLALQRRVARSLLRQVKGDPEEVGFREIERVLEAAADAQVPAFDLPGPVHVRREGDALLLARPPAPRAAASCGVAAETLIRPAGFEPPRVPRAREVYLDADAVAGQVVARNWRPGDRFTPLGMAGSKSLQDLFTDAKVPAAERGNTPVVTDDAGILWVAGVAIADRAKVTPKTKRLLRLRWTEG